MTVDRIIRQKGPGVAIVRPQATVSEVLDALEVADVGAVVVSADGETIEGIVSERDIVRGLRTIGAQILKTSASKLMTRNVVTCELRDPAIRVMMKMDAENIRHVPVVENGKLAGMISIRDIVSDRLKDVESEVSSLNSYISGSQ